jgi:molecular chaperone GrpE (heat shock protein)
MANLKKQHAEEKKLFTALGKENMIREIIPVLDNFDAAFSNEEA